MSADSPPVPAAPPTGVATQIRGSSLLLVGKVLGVGMEFTAQVVAVRYLSKTEYGAFTYALALVVLLQTVCRFGLPDTVPRFIPIERANGALGKVLGVIVVSVAFVLTSGVMIVLGVWLVAPLLGGRLIEGKSLQLVLILSLLIPLDSLNLVLTGIFASYKNPRVILLRGSIMEPLLKLGVAITLIWFGTDVYFLAQGYVATSLLSATLYCWLCITTLRKDGLLDAEVKRSLQLPIRELFPFASTLLLTGLVWILMDTSDALLLGYFKGNESVALLRAVTPLARVNYVITGSFAILFTPIAAGYFARRDRAGMQQMYVRTATWVAVLSFPAFLLAFVFARQIVTALYSESYAASAPILALLSLGYFVQAATGFNGLTIKIYRHLKYAIAIDFAACVLNIGIILLCIPRWGALGAAIGTTATLLIHNGLKQGGMQRLTGVHLYDRHYLRMLATLIALVTGAALLNRLMEITALEAGVVAAVASAVLVYSCRDALQIDRMFPEVLRFPLVRRVLVRSNRVG